MKSLRSFLKTISGRPPEVVGGVHREVRGYFVKVDEEGVICRKPVGEPTSIKWEQLDTIIAQTHEPVPGLPSMMWILGGRGGACVVPQGSRGEATFLKWIHELPGFKADVYLEAKACEEERTFVCWERPK